MQAAPSFLCGIVQYRDDTLYWNMRNSANTVAMTTQPEDKCFTAYYTTHHLSWLRNVLLLSCSVWQWWGALAARQCAEVERLPLMEEDPALCFRQSKKGNARELAAHNSWNALSAGLKRCASAHDTVSLAPIWIQKREETDVVKSLWKHLRLCVLKLFLMTCKRHSSH